MIIQALTVTFATAFALVLLILILYLASLAYYYTKWAIQDWWWGRI